MSDGWYMRMLLHGYATLLQKKCSLPCGVLTLFVVAVNKKTVAGNGLEETVTAWITAITGMPVVGDLHELLKSGEILCDLMNKLHPRAIAKPNKSRMAFKRMENIGKQITSLGLEPVSRTHASASGFHDGRVLSAWLAAENTLVYMRSRAGFWFL